MKSINSKLNYIYLALGLSFIVYIFYVRVIMVRLPKDLYLYVNNHLNLKLAFILAIAIILNIFIIVVNSYLLLSRKPKQKFFSKISLGLNELLDKALFEVYRASELLLQDGYTKIAKIAKLFYSNFGGKTEEFFVFLAYAIKFIIVMVFLLDVFYFFKLNYFYKVLVLLCIPISVNILIYILKDFAGNLEYIKPLLISKEIIDEKTNSFWLEYSLSPGNESLDLKYVLEQFELCSKIKGYLEIYDLVLRYYSIRFNIIIYSLYLIGWLYILYKNFCFFV